MTLAEVATQVRAVKNARGGDGLAQARDELIETIVRLFEDDPEFTLPGRVVEARNVIEADPHDWSARPCGTCDRVSELLGVPFGCHHFGEILLEEK